MNIPNDAEYFIKEGTTLTFWKTCHAFNMKLLEYWDGKEWKMKFGKLPWEELQKI